MTQASRLTGRAALVAGALTQFLRARNLRIREEAYRLGLESAFANPGVSGRKTTGGTPKTRIEE